MEVQTSAAHGFQGHYEHQHPAGTGMRGVGGMAGAGGRIDWKTGRPEGGPDHFLQSQALPDCKGGREMSPSCVPRRKAKWFGEQLICLYNNLMCDVWLSFWPKVLLVLISFSPSLRAIDSVFSPLTTRLAAYKTEHRASWEGAVSSVQNWEAHNGLKYAVSNKAVMRSFHRSPGSSAWAGNWGQLYRELGTVGETFHVWARWEGRQVTEERGMWLAVNHPLL